MSLGKWFSPSIKSVPREDFAGEDWKQDSFRQFMNTLRARYFFARSQLSPADLQSKKDVIDEIERVFRAWEGSDADSSDVDNVERSEEPSESDGPRAAPQEAASD